MAMIVYIVVVVDEVLVAAALKRNGSTMIIALLLLLLSRVPLLISFTYIKHTHSGTTDRRRRRSSVTHNGVREFSVKCSRLKCSVLSSLSFSLLLHLFQLNC